MKPILSRHKIISTLDSKQEDELEYLFKIIKKFSSILLSNKQIFNNKQNWNELRFPYKNLLRDAEQYQIYNAMENVPDRIEYYIECYNLSNKIPRYLFLDITKIKLNAAEIIIPNFGIMKFQPNINTSLLKSENIKFIAICKEDSGILTLYIKKKNNIKQKNKKTKLKNNKFQMNNNESKEENNNSQAKNWYTVLRTSKNFWPYKK